MRLAISSTLGIATCVLTIGCSPAGSINPIAPTDPSSLANYCSRPDVNATLLGGLRKTPDMEGADFQNITTAAATVGTLVYFACHGTLIKKSGASMLGTVTVTGDANGELTASWLSDADKANLQAGRKPTAPVSRADQDYYEAESTAQARAKHDFNEAAKAAHCTTGNKQMCIEYAKRKETELQIFCSSRYAIAALQIWNFKSSGWPAEMTAENGNIPVPAELLIPLVRAGYSGNWKSEGDFHDEAQRRCLNRDFF
jgi:hypothetical protein